MSTNNTQQKNVYVVLGMARSGTSAITRSLKALGIDLGNHLAAAREFWNAKGSWEDEEIVYKINRGVMLALKYSWVTMNSIDSECEHNEDLRGLKNYAYDLLKERTDASDHWGFKDPRTAKILPFWQEIFAKLDVRENYIIALRNPLSSAYSYQRVSGVDIEEALFLWLMHMIPAIDSTYGKRRIAVNYDLMMQNPRLQVERIKRAFDIPDLASPAEIEVYANEFLDKNLQRYEYSREELISHPATAVTPICVEVYDLLLRVAKDELKFDSEEFLESWHEIKSEFYEVYPIYCYMDALMKRNKELSRQLRTIKKSIPWRLVYPLRMIDDVLRYVRKKTRERRKLAKAYA